MSLILHAPFAQQLLHDKEDLIHKVVGWMLREVGKRDLPMLFDFLDEHSHCMPRTMLRYALEQVLASEQRRYYMAQKRKQHQEIP